MPAGPKGSRWRAPAASDGLGRTSGATRAILLADRLAIGKQRDPMFTGNDLGSCEAAGTRMMAGAARRRGAMTPTPPLRRPMAEPERVVCVKFCKFAERGGHGRLVMFNVT